MPLMMLPMAPGAELNLGNSLIPVTGVVLLLKGLVQGNYGEVLRYVVPVCVRDAGVLPSGDSLGRVSVQPGIGAVPRERAARPAAVGGAPGARSAGHAVAGRGVFLRGADLRDSILRAAGDFGGQHAGVARFQFPGAVALHQPGGVHRAAGAVDDGAADGPAAEDAAAGSDAEARRSCAAAVLLAVSAAPARIAGRALDHASCIRFRKRC